MSRNTDKMLRDVKLAKETLAGLSDARIADLVRRAGTRSTGESVSQGPRAKNSVSDPTLGAVIRSMSKRADDPIYDSVQDIARMLNDIATLCATIEHKVEFVTNPAGWEKEKTVLYCLACEREVAGTSKDRLRSGYCAADYQAWIRAGRPYRTQFEAEIQAKHAKTQQ